MPNVQWPTSLQKKCKKSKVEHRISIICTIIYSKINLNLLVSIYSWTDLLEPKFKILIFKYWFGCFQRDQPITRFLLYLKNSFSWTGSDNNRGSELFFKMFMCLVYLLLVILFQSLQVDYWREDQHLGMARRQIMPILPFTRPSIPTVYREMRRNYTSLLSDISSLAAPRMLRVLRQL